MTSGAKMNITRAAAITIVYFTLALTGQALGFHDDHGEGPTDQVFKVGKTGEINITRDVKFGSYLIRRGKYTMTHRVDGPFHIFGFEEINKKKPAPELVVYEVRTRLIGSEGVNKSTSVTAKEAKDHSYEAVVIQLATESGDHLLIPTAVTP
jgi:hypothetical protein